MFGTVPDTTDALSVSAYLGVTIADTGNGVYVSSTEAGGPAAVAGIGTGDVIISVAGKPTLTPDELGAR